MNSTGRAHSIAVVLLTLFFNTASAASWLDGAGFRSLEVEVGPPGKAGFTLMNPKGTGIWFTNALRGDDYLTNAVAHNGSGVAIGDVDGDDRPDIYLCALQGPNRLYRNLGHWRFEEMALGEAACAAQFSTGATFADVDGDADLDLLVNGIAAGTRLFLNDGKGGWTEANTGLSRTASATSLTLADIDGDGDLDLYCAHYIDVMHLADPTTRLALGMRDGRWEVTRVNGESTRSPRWKDRFQVLEGGRVRELPEVHGLYRNDGRGQFTPIQFERGVFLDERGAPIPPYRDWGLAAMFRDLNGDGAPDLYVCNDNASPDRIWINSGQGAFRLIDRSRLRHTSRSSMGIDFADINRDGYDDIIVLDMLGREHRKRMTQLVRDRSDPQTRERIDGQPRYNRNMLFMGGPDGSYAEAALLAGVAATDWSWCPVFVDVDLDGYEDLLVTNGFGFDVMDQDSHDQTLFRQRQRQLNQEQLKRSRQFYPAWPTKNAAFRNRGDGTFEPADREWGFDQEGISYGMALGDFDNDGDLDVMVNNLNGVASLYRNDTARSRIAVRLKGLPPNSQGIGAKIRLVDNAITQSQEIICGGRYLSGDQALRVFAADAAVASGKPLRLEVKWRNGDQTTLGNVQANRIYELDQAKANQRGAATTAARVEPHFKDASSLLGHVHTDEPFDDWARQPLLLGRLSRLGPGLSWSDVNQDGWEDLIVTAGRGGKLMVYTNNHGSNFKEHRSVPAAAGDQGAVVAWPDGRGDRSLLVAVSNYEMSPGQESEILICSSTNLAVQRRPAGTASLGPMAVADIDQDGDLDLFVGGRFRPGRYPEPVSSSLWLNDDGQLQPSQSLSKAFESLGLVSGATFSDLDGDGYPDLALAVEWGPVRVFRNHGGRFEDMTARWGLAGRSGLWTGIATGDFDGDGKLDLAVGNWGRNTWYELYQTSQLRLFYGDWNADGMVELIEAWRDGGNWRTVRDRAWLERGMPELPQRFTTHGAFAMATVQDVLGERYEKAKFLEATHLNSTVFLNRGSHFETIPLPQEAQLAPVFSINVGDFDGDGIEDLFLSQNFYGTASDLSRDDSGRGLWLRGDGKGTFSPIDASISGINIEGEQRGAALADFNRDGRVDLAVSQNSAPTSLYVNQRAKRGLRVMLKGPSANPEGVGAQMRVVYSDGRKGPCRSVQAGSGYWSQDGAVQILGCAQPPVSLWIRWPGGKEQIVPLPEDTWEIKVDADSPLLPAKPEA